MALVDLKQKEFEDCERQKEELNILLEETNNALNRMKYHSIQ